MIKSIDKPARGERNNNPGNLRHGSTWQGLSAQQPDKEFCQFVAVEYGIRAIYKLLQTYQKKYGLNTLASIIERYAPSNENNTVGYLNRVAKNTGIGVNEPINVSAKAVAIALATAIIQVELGYQPYNNQHFERAWELL